jgi:hypothetical protein
MNGITIENNIMYQNGRYGVQFSAATGTGVVIDHNLVYGNAAGSYYFTDGSSTVAYTLGTSITSDPLFVNGALAGFDAHLGAGSPAIGAGYNLSSSFATDLVGAARPASGAWDLGAYVHASGDTTPPTVAITSPTNGVAISGTAVIFLAAASDNVGVASVQFQWDGVNLNNPLTVAPYTLTMDTTAASNGTHSLTAIAWDAAGNRATASPVTVTVTNAVAVLGLPTVTVAATSANAARVGPVNGVFTIARTGDTSAPLAVNYSLAGTAANGSDYAAIGTSLIIPAGAASATVTVSPNANANLINPETAVLALAANLAYTAGSPGNATVTIAGNSVPSTIGQAPGNEIKITCGSVAGKIYRVAYKDNLSDATWTGLSGPITATGTTTSYMDTTSGKTQRFYIVYVTD